MLSQIICPQYGLTVTKEVSSSGGSNGLSIVMVWLWLTFGQLTMRRIWPAPVPL